MFKLSVTISCEFCIKKPYCTAACGALSLPHGTVRYNKSPVQGRYRPGTRATHSCPYLYYRFGWSGRTCQTSGQWNGEAARCELRK